MIVADTDFLSSLIKIGRLHLLQELLKSDVRIPMGVEKEIRKCPDIHSAISAAKWLKIIKVPASKKKIVRSFQDQNPGRGESECLAMGDVILMSDTKAGRYAFEVGKTVIDIPTLLLMCRKANLIDQAEPDQIIEDLEKKDYYKLPMEWIKKLR